jgi:peptidoglycan/xylan/chitin deacetylase (PgdA/CDA1 family)
MLRRLLPALGALLAASTAHAADHGVAVMYHRFGENGIPSTNIRLEQVDQHIAVLKSGAYTVLPLAELVQRMRDNSLPDRAVAITVDDAYRSFLTEGWPRFRRAGLPVTLFVATEPVDSKVRGYLTWDEIRRLRDDGVTIGHHSHRHPYLPSLDAAGIRADLATATARFKAELGTVPPLFAYPYGAWSLEVRQAVQEMGVTAGFGQNSGVMHAGHDPLTLPRFPLNEHFGTVERLRQALDALPLRLSGITPADPVLTRQQLPAMTLTLAEELPRIAQVNCFSTIAGLKVEVSRNGRQVDVRQPQPFGPGYGRLSCTVPAQGPSNRFHWFSRQFYIRN